MLFTHEQEASRRLIGALHRWWLQRRAMAQTRRELHALSDHLLKDLGLHRSGIDLLFR